MHIASARPFREPPADTRPPGRWQDVVLVAQQGLADVIASASADGRLNRQTYQHWLATESALCRINALALDAIADWHVSLPQLRAAAHAWATATRDDALAAAADVRSIDGMAKTMPSQLGQWQTFLESASRSSRAGEALGAVVLHASLMRGAMCDAITTVLELPFVPISGSRYLLQRRRQGVVGGHIRHEALLDAYSAAALASGAQRAADWYCAALAQVLVPDPLCAGSSQGGPARPHAP